MFSSEASHSLDSVTDSAHPHRRAAAVKANLNLKEKSIPLFRQDSDDDETTKKKRRSSGAGDSSDLLSPTASESRASGVRKRKSSTGLNSPPPVGALTPFDLGIFNPLAGLNDSAMDMLLQSHNEPGLLSPASVVGLGLPMPTSHHAKKQKKDRDSGEGLTPLEGAESGDALNLGLGDDDGENGERAFFALVAPVAPSF